MKMIIQGIYEAGLSRTLRNAILIIGFFTLTIHAAWYAKKLNESVWKSLLTLWAGNTLTLSCMAFFSAVHSGQNFFSIDFLSSLPDLPLTMLHGFIYFPIVSIPMARLLKIDAAKINDATAITSILYQGIGHIGCVFACCCYGYPFKYGIYNALTKTFVFPVQLFDAFSCILISVFLAIYFKKKQYNTRGVLYPLMLLVYGFVRLIWEFARDNKKIWLVFSVDAIHSLSLILVGAFGLFIVSYFNYKNDYKKAQKAKRNHKKKK